MDRTTYVAQTAPCNVRRTLHVHNVYTVRRTFYKHTLRAYAVRSTNIMRVADRVAPDMEHDGGPHLHLPLCSHYDAGRPLLREQHVQGMHIHARTHDVRSMHAADRRVWRTFILLCLQIEQFHTVVKGLNRGPRNTLASIRNHYLLLCSSNFTRLTAPVDWVVDAKTSTAATYLARAPSADKRDNCVAPRGKGKQATLAPGDFLQLQELWANTHAGFGLLHARFKKSNQRLARANQLRSIADFKSTRQNVLTAEEKRWQQVDATIMVCTRRTPYTHTHTQRTPYVLYTHTYTTYDVRADERRL